MSSRTQTGIEAWVSRQSMLVTGMAAWTGGLVLAIAAGGHVAHAASMAHARHATSAFVGSPVEAADTDESADTSEAMEPSQTQEATSSVVLPADVVVVARPRLGATELQKP
jgi:hypothetical protein